MPLRVLRFVVVLGVVALMMGLAACGGSGSSSSDPKPAPTLTFSADSTSVNSGQTVNLTWASTNATSLTITPSVLASGQSALPVSGSQSVTINADTTYTAVATGPGGNTQKTVTITVTAAPPTVTFSASASAVPAGSFVTLTWATTNATTFTVSPSILGEDQTSLGLSGSSTVVIDTTTTFTATANGAGGTATATVTVTATAAAPTIALTADPTSIGAGGSSTLTWSGTNVTSVSINGVGTGLAPSGTATVSPGATTTYTATATGPAGTATATAQVTVTAGLSITLTASPTSITPGGSSTLTWVASGGSGAISVTISGVSGTQVSSGSTSVSPSTTTTYNATATDASNNTATSSATVTVVTSTGGLSSIKHIIFMIQENRAFDNYFGKLGAYRASRVSGALPSDVNDLDTLPSGFTINTSSTAPHPNYPIPPFHQRTLKTENLSPSWDESHYDAHITNGTYTAITPDTTFKMDRFLQTTHSVSPDLYDPDGTRPMGYYDSSDLPYYYELATQFAISDAFHSSLLSNTVPNRMYLFAATSIGRCKADPGGHPLWPAPTIFDSLLNAGVSWRYYYQDGVFLSQFQSWDNPKIQGNVYNISNLFSVLSLANADQQLPAVIFIEKGDSTDEHPDNNIQAGAVLVKQILDALMASSAWHDSIFLLAYDEGGGLYDHVPPFGVVPPDDIAPNCPTLTPANFDLSGFRVPFIAISPYSKPHYVSHTNMETTSILKLIETRFNLPPLTERDKAAPDMQEFFDFSNPVWLTPPPLPSQPNECLTDSSRCNQQLEVYPNLP